MSNIELRYTELITKIKRHDWFHDFSDDHKIWLTGRAGESEIIVSLTKIPAVDVARILKDYVPEECRGRIVARISLLRMEAKSGGQST